MNIQQEDDGQRGRFFIEEAGELLAEIIYTWSGRHEMTIHHTNVDEALEGKGIGGQLVKKAIDLAREKKSKVVPLCVFAKAVIDKTPEFQDMIVD
jgi:predicted GNAT family acetyltransferase